MLVLLLACSDDPAPPPPPFEDRVIDERTLSHAFPSKRVKDRTGWAKDLYAAFTAKKLPVTNKNACAAVAIVEQESGYDPDPAVPGLGALVDTWIDEKQASMGKLPGWMFSEGFKAVLQTTAPGQATTFYDQLHGAKTERDVDVTFRSFIATQRARLPAPLRATESAAAFVGFDLDDLNPITTAGCMQVKVDWAEDHARAEGADPDGVRDALYTRAGCLHYGTARLFEHEAGYDRHLYRFADYNAGVYASRNAAFQEMVATLSGQGLALDGDLLRYEKGGGISGTPSQTLTAVLALVQANGLSLSDGRIQRDLAKEKTKALEETETWTQLRALYETKKGKAPPYARLPDVHLDSLKFKKDLTTAWFAQSVEKRYQSCIARMKGQ